MCGHQARTYAHMRARIASDMWQVGAVTAMIAVALL